MTEEVEVPKAAKKPAKRKLTKEAKQRIAASQKARWAEKKSAPVAAVPVSAPAAPDPTVLAFRQQLVPLVEKREIIQQHVRQAQRQLQETQMVLQDHQQALQDTENAINYRLNMIAQLTGQPQQVPMPQYNIGLPGEQNLGGDVYPTYGGIQRGNYQTPTLYQGGEVNLMGNPNIPAGITSIPAPQNQRYASGYVPSGENNPRTESAVDVREDPVTREVMVALANARKQMSVV